MRSYPAILILPLVAKLLSKRHNPSAEQRHFKVPQNYHNLGLVALVARLLNKRHNLSAGQRHCRVLQNYHKFALVALGIGLSACQTEQDARETETRSEATVIAFGSCNRQDKPQPLWDDILATQPERWVWLGDNIYGDTDDMAVLKAKYKQQNANAGYQKLKSAVPMIGIWDDHDYGTNDGGRNYAHREASQQLFHDFIGTPPDAERRQRPGIYHTYDHTTRSGKKITFILLDTRYFKDDITRTSAGYQPDSTAQLLGEEQWKWLSETFRKSTADLHIVATSVQLIPEEHKYEKWANFPTERQRFLDSLQHWKPAPVLLLSGDRHLAEISKLELPELPYPLYEITSSGLTHAGTIAEEPNRHRISALIHSQLNFGVLKIYADEAPLRVVGQVRGEGNEVLAQVDMQLSVR